jgi:hypothetical protein
MNVALLLDDPHPAFKAQQFQDVQALLSAANRPDVLITDFRFAGALRAGWEHVANEVIVVFPIHTELRMFEPLGKTKYAVHTETLDGGCQTKDDLDKFLSVFFRQLAVDAGDARKAAMMAVKQFAYGCVVN